MVGGVWDDTMRLSPLKQILWPLLAVAIVIASGIGVNYISNPFGDAIRLDTVQWTIFRLGMFRITSHFGRICSQPHGCWG